MEKHLYYEKVKFTDWSKHQFLTEDQRKKLIQEKIERAKIQSLAVMKVYKKVT